MDLLSMGLIFVVMVGAMYFLMIRPANKRMKEQQAKIAAIEPGARVVLTSGIFATVRHVGEKQMVVELAPDCVVTVLKAAVARTADADEEEFEFEDEAPLAAPDTAPAAELYPPLEPSVEETSLVQDDLGTEFPPEPRPGEER